MCSSSRAMDLLTADRVVPSAWAAAVRLPASNTRANTTMSSRRLARSLRMALRHCFRALHSLAPRAGLVDGLRRGNPGDMKKNPWVAAILNFFLFGAGTLYNGRRMLVGLLLTLGGNAAQLVEISVSPAGSTAIPSHWPFLIA